MSELSPITIAESKRLVELEAVVAKGMKSFVEVGNALMAIRDEFKHNFPSIGYTNFEEYCQKKWNLSNSQTYRVMDSAKAVSNLPHGGGPASERQARPLTKLDTPAEQQQAWSRATEIAKEEGKDAPTARHAEAAVEEVRGASKPAEKEEPYTPENGLQYARMAIVQLEKIHAKDTQRKAAFAKVRKWLDAQK